MKHLKENNLTYWQHFNRAFKLSFSLAFYSVVCFIHAVLPFLFVDKTSRWIHDMSHRLKHPIYYRHVLVKANVMDKNMNLYPKIYDPRQKEGTITNLSEDSLGGIAKIVSHNPQDPWAHGLKK